MKPATRLTKFDITFHGPHAPGLFDIPSNLLSDWHHIVVGSGPSRLVATSRALSQIRDLGIQQIMGDIEQRAQAALGPHCSAVEGTDDMLMYCVVFLSVER